MASHYEQAERFDEALWAYQQASAAARRRGAVAEARTNLSLALSALDRTEPGPERDRKEIPLRLERAFLAAVVEGYHSPPAADDFERCQLLAGTDPTRDDFVATTLALITYYFASGNLRALVDALEGLRAAREQGRPWLGPVIEGSFGLVACLRGEFAAASSSLERVLARVPTGTRQKIKTVWFQPNDPIVTVRAHLVITRFLLGDLTAAEAQLAQVARHFEGLGFPQGPFNAAYAHFVEIWMRTEAGQPERAAVLAGELIAQAERHGFDIWQLWGTAQLAAVQALTGLGADDPDLAAVSEHITALTGLVDALRAVGAENYLTMFDSLLARLLIAVGRPDEARARVDAALALAASTGMHFYDAELLRLRAGTHTDPDDRRTELNGALELARRQGATLFELRAALDDFRIRGEPARAELVDAVSRFPADSAFPELAHARAALRSHLSAP